MATLEKLGELKAKGILTQEEFDAKKAELLKKLRCRDCAPLATEPTPQRAYRAACPNCGAPVEFRSAASAFAVCSFCRSTVVREGEALRKIGESAELFDDHSPLQLGASGKYQGAAFTLVGRLQYRYAEGTWNEWHALFDSGKSGWLSEDNGRYVIAFDAPLTRRRAERREPARRRAGGAGRAALDGRVGHDRDADRGAGRAAVPADCSAAASSSRICAARATRSARWTTATRPRRAGPSAARWRSANSR